MSKVPTFGQAGREWEKTLATKIQRKGGRPLSHNTQRIYAGTLARLIEHMGAKVLPVSNLTIKNYIAELRGKYSDGVIVADIGVIQLVHESVTNEHGDCVYPLKINHEFCGTPIVDRKSQRTPCATRADVERGLTASGITSGMVAIFAGCGLRISELLALHVGDIGGADAWDGDNSVIHIRRTLKTPDAERTIFLPLELNGFLVSWYRGLDSIPKPGERLFPVSRSEIYRQLKIADLPSPHSFRRFRATAWNKAGMNEKVLERLLGHSHGTSVTARYVKTADNNDQEFIRQEIVRCGLGFNLPTFTKSIELPEEVSA